ncbi:MAG TPA: RNA polymerase sigma factor [Solirubrobacterales bacterium]|nr:RNA polymerase sigma factor [Solirubrobacterales bacterium]
MDGEGGTLVAAARDSVVDRTFRHESGRAVATLIRVTGDFDLAEEAVQEAFVVALERWPSEGVPSNPGAWITQVSRNGAIDRIRREGVLRDKVAVLERLEALHAEPEAVPGDRLGEIEDDRLRLIFTCCHPALAIEARVALTLRSLGGLSTPEIARALLASESATAQRIVRAKRKIAANRIPYEVPVAEQMPERLPAVLATLYLIFNEGYLASGSEALVRTELSGEAIRLTRALAAMLPREPEASGLLALMLLSDARRAARLDQHGEIVLLEDQDRSLWDREQIEEGLELSREAAAGGPTGPYTVQARIAAVHAEAASAAETDWPRIARLYAWHAEVAPSPVVELNRAVAVAMCEGPGRGLELIEEIDGLDNYLPLHTARAGLLRRLDHDQGATEAYSRALELDPNPVERRFIERRLAELTA